MQTDTIRSDFQRTIREAVNDAVTRAVAVAALGGIALVHVLQSPFAFDETTYLGVLFVGAIVASLALAATLTRTSDRRAWAAAGGLALLILLGYLLSRTSGLPDATDDVGEWSEPLGLASLVVEGLLVFLTAGVLTARLESSGRGAARPADSSGRPVPGTRPGPAAGTG